MSTFGDFTCDSVHHTVAALRGSTSMISRKPSGFTLARSLLRQTNPAERRGEALDVETNGAPDEALDWRRVVNWGRILVPLSFSPASNRALEVAMSFSRQFNANLEVLHVTSTRDDPPELERAEHDLAEMLWTIPEDIAPRTRFHLNLGDVFDCVAQAAENLGVDAVILGRSRRPESHVLDGLRTAVRCPIVPVAESESLSSLELMTLLALGLRCVGPGLARTQPHEQWRGRAKRRAGRISAG
jgi:nucleotide-binding universal stress UspA family protein